MRIFKSHPLLKLVNSYLIDSPQPSNLSVTLAMHYNPSVLEAFNSVEHIMRDCIYTLEEVYITDLTELLEL
ncbi:cytochrome b [Lachnellula occidentalis]|uniref:Cytochrome b n=1 Tax=Lachnellula occidentalis TaxID=215460 RepID=A0A8H8RIY8_9HELO|nr:cytochrome b [Lachnellula occidentalis]